MNKKYPLAEVIASPHLRAASKLWRLHNMYAEARTALEITVKIRLFRGFCQSLTFHNMSVMPHKYIQLVGRVMMAPMAPAMAASGAYILHFSLLKTRKAIVPFVKKLMQTNMLKLLDWEDTCVLH